MLEFIQFNIELCTFFAGFGNLGFGE